MSVCVYMCMCVNLYIFEKERKKGEEKKIKCVCNFYI